MLLGGAIAVAVGLVLGSLVGAFIFRQSRRWCTLCGATLRCVDCLAHDRRAVMENVAR